MWMEMTIASGLLLVGFTFLFIRVATRMIPPAESCIDWLDEFSMASYRPMANLLDESDYEFLAAQRGYEPAIARRLRRERRAIFQSYLMEMARDFHRLLGAARIAMVYAPNDQSALASELFRLRVRFYGALIGVEVRYAMNALGLGKVDASAALGLLESMYRHAITVVPVAQEAV